MPTQGPPSSILATPILSSPRSPSPEPQTNHSGEVASTTELASSARRTRRAGKATNESPPRIEKLFDDELADDDGDNSTMLEPGGDIEDVNVGDDDDDYEDDGEGRVREDDAYDSSASSSAELPAAYHNGRKAARRPATQLVPYYSPTTGKKSRWPVFTDTNWTPLSADGAWVPAPAPAPGPYRQSLKREGPAPVPIPARKAGGSKLTVQLKMDLNIEIMLKAKIEGDITLTLL